MLFFSRTDSYVVGACAAVIFVAGTLLYLESNRRVQAGGEEIGRLAHVTNVAQRKYADQVIWESLDDDIPVYNKDSIRTGDYSRARVRLADGTEIEIAENSMIVLNISGESADINFVYGSINAKRGEDAGGGGVALSITSEDKVITIDDGADSDIQLNKGDSNAALDVVVNSGEATVQTESGQATTIGKDERASLSGETIEVRKISLRPQGPGAGAQFFLEGGARNTNVSFTWAPVQGNPTVRLEVSRKRDFSESALDRSVKGTRAGGALGQGTYYWRLSAKNNSGQTDYSEVRNVSVLRNTPLSLQAPATGRTFDYVNSPPFINFSWSENELADSYVLEVAGDRAFRNIVQARTVRVRSTSLSLEEGDYFWRVRTQSEIGGGSVVSPPNAIRVVRREKIPAPEPIAPVDGRTIARVLLAKEGAVFSWRKTADIRRTEVEIARDRNFNDIVQRRETANNYASIRADLPEGTYYWRLRGTDRTDTPTDFSSSATFTVGATERLSLLTPANGAGLDLQGVARSGVDFRWKKPEIPGNFELIIHNNETFSGKAVVVQRLPGINSRVTRLQQGTYFWKVRLLGPSGDILTESDSRRFDISDSLEIPVAIFPGTNATVDVTNLANLTLRWRQSGGAYYELTLTDARGRRILTDRVNRSEFTIRDLTVLSEGRVNWSVKACHSDGECSPAMQNSFALTAQKLPPPESTTPDRLYVVDTEELE